MTLDLLVQLDTLNETVPAIFLNATQFRIADAAEWRRDTGKNWSPHVLSKSMVRNILLRADISGVSDINGCLQSTLEGQDLIAKVFSPLGIPLEPVQRWTVHKYGMYGLSGNESALNVTGKRRWGTCHLWKRRSICIRSFSKITDTQRREAAVVHGSRDGR